MTDPTPQTTPTRDEAVQTKYWWLIEMPDKDGSSLYLMPAALISGSREDGA